MICPNCGRRNSAGATFCSRCRQRLPLADKLAGNQRRTVMVEPRGGGGGGAIVLGVALLAGFLFIGGAAAIYLSSPQDPGSGQPTNTSDASSTPTLAIFVQPTATPSATPSPTFILLPSDSPSPSPSITPSPPPTPAPLVARFAWNQHGPTLTVTFSDRSTGGPTGWEWDFGDSVGVSTDQNTSYGYAAYGTYTVTLKVTGANGSSTKTKTVTVQAPECDSSGGPPGCIATPPPSPAPVDPAAPPIVTEVTP